MKDLIRDANRLIDEIMMKHQEEVDILEERISELEEELEECKNGEN